MKCHVSTCILNFQWANQSLKKSVKFSLECIQIKPKVKSRERKAVFAKQANDHPNYLPRTCIYKESSSLGTVITGSAGTHKLLALVFFFESIIWLASRKKWAIQGMKQQGVGVKRTKAERSGSLGSWGHLQVTSKTITVTFNNRNTIHWWLGSKTRSSVSDSHSCCTTCWLCALQQVA